MKKNIRRDIDADDFLYFYQELYENQLFTDFTIITNDGGIFNVHKSVLYFSCSYFKTLFLSKTKENIQNKIHFQNICAAQMDLLLHYTYGYEIEIVDDNLLDILVLADMLGDESLFDICIEYIRNIEVNSNNAMQVFDFLNKFSHIDQVFHFHDENVHYRNYMKEKILSCKSEVLMSYITVFDLETIMDLMESTVDNEIKNFCFIDRYAKAFELLMTWVEIQPNKSVIAEKIVERIEQYQNEYLNHLFPLALLNKKQLSNYSESF